MRCVFTKSITAQAHVKLIFREEPGNGLQDWIDGQGSQQGKWLSNDMQVSVHVKRDVLWTQKRPNEDAKETYRASK